MTDKIETLGVVGTGQMGRGIAQIAAVAGLPVHLYDSRPEAAAEARNFIGAMLTRGVVKGRMTAEAAEQALARLSVVQGLQDLADCDLVIEAIIEDLDAKRSLFAELETILGERAIIASNTSSLSVTAIASACRRPERVAGYHFFNPVPLMKLVEVIDGARSDPKVCESLAALAERMGHRPVRAKDSPGFLVNHAGRGYGTEALRVLAEGVAEPADIDRIMREAAGFPMGPFELLDLTGLDVSHAVMESIYHQYYEEPRFRPQPETRRRVAAGLLGRKTGEGWYGYPDGKIDRPAEAPMPEARPSSVWISGRDKEGREQLTSAIADRAVPIESSAEPSANALCLVTPLGEDATSAALAEGLDPSRTLAVDTLLGLDKRITLMATPLTQAVRREEARGLLGAGGVPVTVIADSPGFVAQRILACVVNVACEIAQLRIASPEDIDEAVRLGLGYPAGPLDLGNRLGPSRVLRILEKLQQLTGDPRYRPSLWLRRRSALGVSLHSPDLA